MYRRLYLCFLLAASLLCGSIVTAQSSRQTALNRLEQQLQAGEITGRIVERTPGVYWFMPAQRDLLGLPIRNPEQVAPASVGPLLRLEASIADGKLQIERYVLELNNSTMPVAAAPLEDPERVLRSTLSNFSRAATEIMQPGVRTVLDPRGNSPFVRAARATERNIQNVYQDAVARDDDAARRQAVSGYAEVRQQLKAIYDTYDNYPPWSYQQIFANSQSVVALGRPGERNQAICSGVLIASDLVLTAAHCFAQDAPPDLQIWFGFTTADDGSVLEPQRRPVTELLAPPAEKREAFLQQIFGAELYDYAIVRFDPGEALTATPQCLRKFQLSRGKPLYVIGYPKGQRETVHDNGRVYLPFQLRPQELDKLQLEIETDYLEHQDRIAIMEEFTAAYVELDVSGFPAFQLFDPRYGGQPKMGIVADTFRGNSGSPVYDRDGHCVAGILIGGAPDVGTRLPASWQHHESVLPISAIIADLQQHETTKVLLDEGILKLQ